AVTLGQIADVLSARGELDEALRIRREEELPVYEKLGDVRSRAVTLGKIAGVLSARGELDEALRTLRNEVLPTFDKLGAVRERAVTLGQIADVLSARGELDEALRIRREEQLPVYEKLGDVRERALTLCKIADVLSARGELDEALRTLRNEVLPTFDKLEDVRSRAVTLGKVADILRAQGDSGGALSAASDWLQGVQRLGDSREIAVAQFNIAQIELRSGKHDGVLERLADSFARMRTLRIPEGVAAVGEFLGTILAQIQHPQARQVLLEARAAATARGDQQAVARLSALIE
ncbi:MAG: hypothetical protein MUC36_16995, partial [Planctomycetes bacterium]|nr:hypothetical protein [Planctomycetota bacterium]